jgi:hypothetical protein
MGGCGGLPSGVPGLDGYNFSYNIITQTIVIRFNQQMIVADEIIINEGEELRIEGQLVLIV